MSPALYLTDTSGWFRILRDGLRQAWSDQLVAGVIASCPVVELKFLHSARSLADRLEKQRLNEAIVAGAVISDGDDDDVPIPSHRRMSPGSLVTTVT
jgi:hypothetical protein